MPERKFKVIPAVLVTALLVAISLVAYELVELNRPISRPPLPNPNGFETLLEAAKLSQHTDLDLSNATPDELRAYLERNRQAIYLIEKALTQRSRVTPRLASERMHASSVMLKTIPLLNAEVQLAQIEGRTNDIVRSNEEMVRLGETISSGGLVIEKMVGFIAASSGLKGLHLLSSSLGDTDCRELIESLQGIRARREPLETVWAREKAETRRLRSLDQKWFGIRALFSDLAAAWQYRGLKQKFGRGFKKSDAKLDLVIIELAIHRYSLSNRTLPKQLGDLIPQYLNAVPKDPFSGTDFIYRLKPNGYQLYSVGPDGKDDGGARLTTSADSDLQQGDLSADSF